MLDTVSDSALGPVTELYDRLGLDYWEFTRLAFPYVLPETVRECPDRAAADATRYLVAGLVPTELYGMELFPSRVETPIRGRPVGRT